MPLFKTQTPRLKFKTQIKLSWIMQETPCEVKNKPVKMGESSSPGTARGKQTRAMLAQTFSRYEPAGSQQECYFTSV